MSSTPAEITGLYRYPIKGLNPESLPRVALRAGETLPADRRYAIENGPTGFDPARTLLLLDPDRVGLGRASTHRHHRLRQNHA